MQPLICLKPTELAAHTDEKCWVGEETRSVKTREGCNLQPQPHGARNGKQKTDAGPGCTRLQQPALQAYDCPSTAHPPRSPNHTAPHLAKLHILQCDSHFPSGSSRAAVWRAQCGDASHGTGCSPTSADVDELGVLVTSRPHHLDSAKRQRVAGLNRFQKMTKNQFL